MLIARKFLLLWLVFIASFSAATVKDSSSTKTEKAPAAKKPAAKKNPDQEKVKTATAEIKKLKVVTTLSVIAALVKEIGGEFIEVNALSSATEDPHFVKAKPTFKRLVSDADLFMQIGRSLELWVPLVITSSGNSKLTGDGIVSVSDGAKTLELPQVLSRAQGDIHPFGNPHVWLSALGGLKMAETIKRALIMKDSAHKDTYEKNFAAFKRKLAEATFGSEIVQSGSNVDFLWRLHEGKRLKTYLAQQKPKKEVGGFLKMAEAIDYPFITYHTVWSYLADEFGLKVFGQIEEKSGLAPSLKYQNELVKKAVAAQVKHIVAASYYVGNGKLIDLIANQIGGTKIFVDVDCRTNEDFIAMLTRIMKALVDNKSLPEKRTT